MFRDDVPEWFLIAEEDLISAKILFEHVKQPCEIICYHCAQSVEKFLKGYIAYQNIEPKKTHNLIYLNEECRKVDNMFLNVLKECAFINRFANEVRYPHRIGATPEDAEICIKFTDKIKEIKPIRDIFELIK